MLIKYQYGGDGNGCSVLSGRRAGEDSQAYLVLTACWVLPSWATDADPSNPPTTSEARATVLILQTGVTEAQRDE